MVPGARGVLGIEIGSSHLRVVHGAIVGHMLTVHDFAQEETLFSGPENNAQQLESLLERKRLRSIPAALTLSGPGVVYRLLDLPPMPPDELGVVVEREMRAVEGASGDDAVFDWEVIRESGARSVKQLRVLVAMAPRSQVAGAQQLLALCGLKPALITTVPVSLLRGLRFVQGDKSGSQTVLYVGDHQGYLLGVQDRVWDFYREFSSRSLEEGGSTLPEEAVKEAIRVLLYHRQSQGDGRETTFLLSGHEGLEEVRTRLAREAGIQVEVLQPGPGLDLSPVGERGKIFRDLFSSLVIPVGLVTSAYLPDGINFVRKGARNSRWITPNIDFSFAQRPRVALIVLLVFLGLHLILVHTERKYQRLLDEKAASYSSWQPAISAAQQSQALRESEKLVEQSLGTNRLGDLEWIRLIKALSQLSHPDLVLQSLSVQREKETWLITLKGQIVSPDAYAAQVVFNRFYQGLKSSAFLEQIELLPLNVTTLKEKIEEPGKKAPGAPAGSAPVEIQTGGVEVKKTKVEFELRGQAREI